MNQMKKSIVEEYAERPEKICKGITRSLYHVYY